MPAATSREMPAVGELTFRVPFNPRTLELVESRTPEDLRALRVFVGHCGSLEHAWDRCDRSDWLLALLQHAFEKTILSARPLQVPLRRFACWCARDWQPTGTQLDIVLDAAEAACEGRVSIQRLDEIRRTTIVAALPAAVMGVPRCDVNAAAMLGAWHAANPDAFSAAIWAARFAVLAAGFTVAQNKKHRTEWPPAGDAHWPESFRARYYAETNADVITAAERFAQQRQAEVLRFMLANPFATEQASRRSNAASDSPASSTRSDSETE